MRLACKLLLLLLVATNLLQAQSNLTIDKLDHQGISTSALQVAFSALLEGTVSDPTLAVHVLVYESSINGWKSYPATVDGTRIDAAGGYRWRAICRFGEYHGTVGLSYTVRAIAINPARIQPGNLLGSLSAISFQSSDISITRVKQ
jgi:hypothetical protein